MATHSSILAWRIPRTEEPGRLQSTGSQSRTQLRGSVGTRMHTHMPWTGSGLKAVYPTTDRNPICSERE